MGVSYVKFCPRCQTTTGVDVAICPNCGHRFRTHFQPPVSEKTVAMTSPFAPAGDYSQIPAEDAGRLPFRIPRIFLLALLLLTAAGITLGIKARHAQQAAPARPIITPSAFQPYSVVFKGGGPDRSQPVATHSLDDLIHWENARSPHSQNAASSEDSPARVHLYLSGRILLADAGTAARVIQEQGKWRKIEILDGPHRGATGYVSQDAVTQPGAFALTPSAPLPQSH